ncbi:MAG: hypothetical protein NWE76_04545 [Candidatus Bathyarchaeota archaeon]|nr:hypothetical protein [Candidatus Bathyarchaeota archaeon]
MKKKEQTEAKDIVASFFKDVLANFFVVISVVMLAILWMTMA